MFFASIYHLNFASFDDNSLQKQIYDCINSFTKISIWTLTYTAIIFWNLSSEYALTVTWRRKCKVVQETWQDGQDQSCRGAIKSTKRLYALHPASAT